MMWRGEIYYYQYIQSHLRQQLMIARNIAYRVRIFGTINRLQTYVITPFEVYKQMLQIESSPASVLHSVRNARVVCIPLTMVIFRLI